jgi:hypothetical protein
LNLRPSGYEPDELPGCSTPRFSDQRTEIRGQTGRTSGKRVVGREGAAGRDRPSADLISDLWPWELLARPGDDPLSHR